MQDTFLKTARNIIDNEDIEAITIRKVADLAGYNSATLYLYFADLDELVTLSLVGYLEDYSSMIVSSVDQMQTALTSYLYSWKVFCRFATIRPHMFWRLFFMPHNKPLAEIVERYYEIYPRRQERLTESVCAMLVQGDLLQRNMAVLRPLVPEGLVEERNLELINVLTVNYFRSLLSDFIKHLDEISLSDDSLAQQMNVANLFLLGLQK